MNGFPWINQIVYIWDQRFNLECDNIPQFLIFLSITPDMIFPFMSDLAPVFSSIPLIESLSSHLLLAVLPILKGQMEGLQKSAYLSSHLVTARLQKARGL